MSGLKKCDSLESLNFVSDSSYSSGSFDITARIYELNGLKNLKNLKKLSLGSFNFFGVDGGNLMNDTKQEKSNIDNKVSLSDIQMVDNVIRYKAIPYTGTVVNYSSYGKICEYEVVDGLQNGIYKEFYETGKVKLEALIKKNRPNKITGFYNAEGENILQAVQTALDLNCSYILFSASGGMRMMESSVSLAQMTRMTIAISSLKKNKLPFINVFCNPTAGGTTASISSLSDIAMAEKGATIAFSGKRVIQATIKEPLPDNFQKAEWSQEHGFCDIILERKDIPKTLHSLLSILLKINTEVKLENLNETSELISETREAS